MFLLLVVSIVYQSKDKTSYNSIKLFSLDFVYLFGENAKISMFICDVTAELMNIN